MRLLSLAGCLAMLMIPPAIAQTPAETLPAETVPAAPDALVDRFMAALPHQEEFLSRPQGEEAELARLTGLNAGHEKDVRAVVAAHQACLTPVVRETTVRVLRALAAGLGATKLEKLIAFYSGPDGRLLEQLAAKADRGRNPSAADQQELARIMAAYPLGEWAGALRHSGAIVAEDPAFLAAMTKCDSDKQAALARAHLHS